MDELGRKERLKEENERIERVKKEKVQSTK